VNLDQEWGLPDFFPLHDYATKAASKATARRVSMLVVYMWFVH